MVLSAALRPPKATETTPFLVRFLKLKLVKLPGVSWRGSGSAACTTEEKANSTRSATERKVFSRGAISTNCEVFYRRRELGKAVKDSIKESAEAALLMLCSYLHLNEVSTCTGT
jgi:hypothetical protein